VPLALETLGIKMVVLIIKLQRDAGVLFVGHHEVQVLAMSAANERGLARI
jgi:hypothetical protein